MTFLIFKQSFIKLKEKLNELHIQHLPYLIQCNKSLSFIDNTEFESSTYLITKSFIFVSTFKLYFTYSVPRDLISAERVLDLLKLHEYICNDLIMIIYFLFEDLKYNFSFLLILHLVCIQLVYNLLKSIKLLENLLFLSLIVYFLIVMFFHPFMNEIFFFLFFYFFLFFLSSNIIL